MRVSPQKLKYLVEEIKSYLNPMIFPLSINRTNLGI